MKNKEMQIGQRKQPWKWTHIYEAFILYPTVQQRLGFKL